MDGTGHSTTTTKTAWLHNTTSQKIPIRLATRYVPLVSFKVTTDKALNISMKRLLIVAIVAIIWPLSLLAQEWKWENAYHGVVLVSTEQQIVTPNSDSEISPNGPPMFAPPPKYGMGTGFFIDELHIVTNYHVIKDVDAVKLYAYGYPFEIETANVVGFDEESDIAVLKIDQIIPHGVLQFSDTDPLIGDTVYALGHGAGQYWSLTQGIISYDTRPNPNTSWVHYLQTDAVINSGNSGGPLLNDDGEVVGVNTLILSPSGMYQGYGYAIPSALVERIATRLIKTGTHVKPHIGIHMGVLEDKEVYETLVESGKDYLLEVKRVKPNGPAELFGVKENDIIVSLDGQKVYVVHDMIRHLWSKDPGDTLSMLIYRNGSYHTIDVILDQGKDSANLYGKSAR